MFDTRLAAPLALSFCTALAACPSGRGAQAIRPDQPMVEAKERVAAEKCEKGCKEGSALACYRLAQNTRAGDGTAKDKGKAIELLERACQGGHEAACSEK